MTAIIIDLKNCDVHSPEQHIRIFFSLYNHSTVTEGLWEAFRGYAVNHEKDLLGLTISEQKIAGLFDRLIDLVGALEVLRATGSTERCPICGRIES